MSDILKDVKGDVKKSISLATKLTDFFDTMQPLAADLLFELKRLNDNADEMKKGIEAVEELNKTISEFKKSM